MNIYRSILKKYWRFDSFRTLQEEIIESVGRGKDTLALMPTGGGKSITFQVPALAREGLCLVVTPLIALMKDQVENLHKRQIKALAIHSGMTRDEISVALDNCVFGDYKFLYLSPERLSTEIFRVRVQQMNINLIAVDEAHCISQWGYDFRPSYLKIAELKELLPGVPVLALTATATPEVARDIMDRLAFREANLLKKSFERENLTYSVVKAEDKYRELLKIVSNTEGSGIVYTRNRRKTRELAEMLLNAGINADYYHAGLKYEARVAKQEAWQTDKTRVMVSTNAFGMGIDKPDVRFVIHVDLPDSPEAYFQEAGRAGRDEKDARAILIYSPADDRLVERRIKVSFPDYKVLKEVYRNIYNFLQIPVGSGKGARYDFIMGEFMRRYKYNALTLTSALTILSREGYFEVTDDLNNPSRIHFICNREELYRYENDPKYDKLIKTLLRSYSGLFSQFVSFDEQSLAKRAGFSQPEVYEMLKLLSSRKIISFIPKRQNPVISLLEERLDDKNVYISRERYHFRKERFIDRSKTMLQYARSENKCRSQFLLMYFGEVKAKRCGKCDYCLSQIDQKERVEEHFGFEEKLQDILKHPKTFNEICELLNMDEDVLSEKLTYMLENGTIMRGKDLKFELRKRKN